jgi:primase-polymerase (primpol)-like protein
MKLQDWNQWCCWRNVIRGEKKTKIPTDTKGKLLSTSNTKCHMTFDKAFNAWMNSDCLSGIGFIFTEDDPFCGIDLDEIGKWYGAQQIIDKLNSYTEPSPSGNGLHILCEGYLPGEKHGRKVGSHETGEIAIYDAGRFFTVTLRPIGERKEIVKNQEAINWLCKSLEDNDLLVKIGSKPYGEKFKKLYHGFWKEAGYQSQSEADLAFCRIINNINGGVISQIDRIMRKSKLMRNKWDEMRGNETYGYHTLEIATNEENRTDRLK